MIKKHIELYKVQEHIFLHLLILFLFSSLFFFPMESFKVQNHLFCFILFFSFGLNIYCSMYYSMNSFRLAREKRRSASVAGPAITVMPRVHRARGNQVSAGFTASAELTAVQNWYPNKFILGSVLNVIYITDINRAKILF